MSNQNFMEKLLDGVELKTTVAKIDQLRGDIDTIVAEIEGAVVNDR